MKTIGVHANLTEVNRYEFDVQVDENASDIAQNIEAKRKVKKFLENNIPSPNIGADFIDGVRCIDVDYGVESVNNLEDEIKVNKD
jgi:hypothetical protein